MDVFVCDSAVRDYCAKVAPGCGFAAARRAILAAEHGILAAAAIGCRTVRLPCRARLVLVGAIVTEVLEPDRKRSCRSGRTIRRNDKGRQKWRCSMEEMEQ